MLEYFIFAIIVLMFIVQMVYARRMDMALEELKRAIEHSTSVQAAAVTLIKDLADKLNNWSQNPDGEAMRRMAAELRAKADELASAIALHADEEEGEEEESGEEAPVPTGRRRT